MIKILKKFAVCLASAAAATAAAFSINSFAGWEQIGLLGDLNSDKKLTVADMVIMTKHLLGGETLTEKNGYDLAGKFIGIRGEEGFLAEKFLETADVNQDGRIDIYDLILLRKALLTGGHGMDVWEWKEEVTQTQTTASTSTQTTSEVTTATAASSFITPPIYELYGSMPSQGEAKAAVFYVDFPDCKYEYIPSASEIENVVFGTSNENDQNYPFESMSAFYKRSSKGAVKLSGKAYTYTTKQNKAAYEGDAWHVALVDEIIAEFDASVDFSEFDGDGDKVIDTILISVPTAAGDDNWWASAGAFGGESRSRADGMDIGHVIVGNAQIESADDHRNFNSSYLHEMGHCMGLPDFYLYGADDFQGMHGSAGFEMMDDAICDFGAASKLMLGWYTPEQVQIYGKSSGTKTFTLKSSQTNDGNCLIIPVGDLNKNYNSEFFILEYTDLSGNNKGLTDEWWRSTGSGVRMYHVEASITGDQWYNTYKYSSGNDEATNNNNGRRFIRLVGEGTDETDNLLRTGDVIDSNMPDFKAYDANGGRTADMGITINIGEKNSDSYEVTVSVN